MSLNFDLGEMPLASPKAINKVFRTLGGSLPGLFTPAEKNGWPPGVSAASMHFPLVRMEGWSSDNPFYMHARNSGQAIPDITQAEKLSVVSGLCLFGKYGIEAEGNDGAPVAISRPGIASEAGHSKITNVKKRQQQLAVPEYAARLGRVMTSLAQYAEANEKPIDIFVHIPEPEYRIYQEIEYQAEGITLSALEQYCALLQAEAEVATQMFTIAFEKSGVEPPAFGSPVSSIIENVPIGSLEADDFVGTNLAGSTLHDVIDNSWTTPYHESIAPGVMPVFVEHFVEAKIYDEAKAQYPEFGGLALYPFPACVSPEHGGRLYRHQDATLTEIAQAVDYWA